jgi:hypothetical protein
MPASLRAQMAAGAAAEAATPGSLPDPAAAATMSTI